MKRIAKVLLFGSGVGLFALGVGIYSWRRTRENPHYHQGIRYVVAADFPAASTEFRQCLLDEPENSKAKGMLAYSVLRSKFDDGFPQDQVEAKLLTEFVRNYTLLSLQETLPNLRESEGKKKLQEVLKAKEEALKDQFRLNRIPFRDWQDFRVSSAAAMEDIYQIRYQPDDQAASTVKAIASSILARGGDEKAADFLMERCASSPAYLGLTIVAGEPLQVRLSKEVNRRGTFIEEESRGALRLLLLRPEINNFVAHIGTPRLIKVSDLPSDQQQIVQEKNSQNLFPDDFSLLLRLEALGSQGKDPLAVDIEAVAQNDKEIFAVLTAYDGSARSARIQIMHWNGSSYEAPKNSSMHETLPYSQGAVYDSHSECLAIPIYKVQSVKRSKVVNGTQTVTRYRQEDQWNPTKYLFNGTYYGGYDQRLVPYDEEIPTEHTDSWMEPAIGRTWRVYAWDETQKTLTLRASRWQEGPNRPDDLFAKKKVDSSSDKNLSMSPKVKIHQSEVKQTQHRDSGKTDLPETGSYASWSDFEIQYRLTELAVIHGYVPIKARARVVLQQRMGADYNPIPGISMATAEAAMSRSEHAEYRLLARIREKRKAQGRWQSPW